jgi:hypothetical protein
MATFTTLAPITQRPSLATRIVASKALFVSACTVLAFLLLGYHPYTEDGGIYAAAMDLRLHPSLFPADRAFAVGQTSRTLFVPLIASLTQAFHLRLPVMLLLLQVCALAATITAALILAPRLFYEERQQRWTVLTLTVSLGVPIAGTSLFLCDPYITPRSFTTPLILLAINALLRRRFGTMAACMAVAFALHPLMAVWASVLLLVLLARQSTRPVLLSLTAAIVVLSCMGMVHAFSPSEGAAAHAAALSRDYWYLSEWDVSEIIGLVAPPLLLLWLTYRRAADSTERHARDIAFAVAIAVVTVTLGSILFVRERDTALLLARIQPLRLLHPVYLLLPMILGGRLAQSLPGTVRWLPATATALGLVCMQISTYPASGYFELPGALPTNAWVQAFLWTRDNTPADDVFALDANYTTDPGEDAHTFRAIAQRSQLPDAAKDGGISSVMPTLAADWQRAATAQAGLNTASDADRIRRVKPLGATWIVLPASAATAFACRYSNIAAKVCHLP